jgi:hypothetical protein
MEFDPRDVRLAYSQQGMVSIGSRVLEILFRSHRFTLDIGIEVRLLLCIFCWFYIEGNEYDYIDGHIWARSSLPIITIS